jgi:hypothetical protein
MGTVRTFVASLLVACGTVCVLTALAPAQNLPAERSPLPVTHPPEDQLTTQARRIVPLTEKYQRRADGTLAPDSWPVFAGLINTAAGAADAVQKSGPNPDVRRVYDFTLTYTSDAAAVKSYGEELDEIRAATDAAFEIFKQAGVHEKLAALPALERMVRPPQTGMMVGWLLPELGMSRNLARLNAGRMTTAWRAGDGAGTAARAEESLAMGRLLAQQHTLIDHLVGVAIQALVFNRTRELLVEKPADASTLRALLDVIDRQPLGTMEVALEGERVGALDAVDYVYDEKGEPRLERVRELAAMSAADAAANMAFGIATRDETVKFFNDYYDRVIAASRLPRAERRGALAELEGTLERLPRNQLLGKIMLPALGRAMHSRDQIESDRAGTRLLLAIELHKVEKGAYPATLDALVPAYLPSIPRDPFAADGAFRYRRLDDGAANSAGGRGYVLYSVGGDGEDNNGTWPENSSPFPYSTDAKGFDYVFNRAPAQ